jgi:hypothetical protein
MRIFFGLVLIAGLLVGGPILVCMVIAHYKISTTEMLLGCIALGVLFPNRARNLL